MSLVYLCCYMWTFSMMYTFFLCLVLLNSGLFVCCLEDVPMVRGNIKYFLLVTLVSCRTNSSTYKKKRWCGIFANETTLHKTETCTCNVTLATIQTKGKINWEHAKIVGSLINKTVFSLFGIFRLKSIV